MNNDNQIWNLAEAYLAKTLSPAEQVSLEQRLASDTRFRSDFEEALNLISSLNQKGAQQRFKNTLSDIHAAMHTRKATQHISLKSHYLRTGAVAAGVAILTSLGISWYHNHHQDTTPRYSELRKVKSELEGIRQSQNRIIRDLDNKANKPLMDNKYSGTGFALTNDGYVITNYHVTEGADSVYIQTRNGEYFKASTISFDAKSDIAILKVESRKFRFNKQQSALPYTFATAKKSLGERVFTLGYPQDEIVYSEGYVSSRNGFMGDSMQYRLELPAEPGQSGAPVMDASGNIVAIVTGKESQSVNITYAVSSNTLLRMLRSIPQNNTISLPKSGKLGGLAREKQIEKLQDYTCVVNVYK